MKTAWVNACPWNKSVVIAALESGADAVIVPDGCHAEVRKLGLIKTVAKDGDIRPGRDVHFLEIRGKSDVDTAVKLSKTAPVVVRTTDWTVIPLENMVAQAKGLIAEVRSYREAETALQILEKGVDGILLSSKNVSEIKKTVAMVKQSELKVNLEKAKITRVVSLGMADRACIDTCTSMTEGQGMLVGNTSAGMFLVHAETPVNPYVEPRPFRINAGAVHAYALMPGAKTRYLSELKAGDEVLIVDSKGSGQVAFVGRSKIEKRPMMLVEAKAGKQLISLVLQNAETIRLTRPNGKPVSIISLKKNDEVLVYRESSGRHFGIKVEETVTEK